MNTLWQQLAAAGLVTGELPPAVASRAPWYVTAMLGFAAWIAAIFLTIVIVLLFDGKNSIGFSGVIACAAGLALLRRDEPFLNQLGLAASIAGQAGLLLGLSGAIGGYRVPCAILAVILIGPSLLTTNAFYRAWCTTASILLFAASFDQWAPLATSLAAAIATIVFIALPELDRAYGYGAAVALIVIDALSIYGLHAPLVPSYIGGALAAIALVYASYHLLNSTIPAALIGLVLIPASGVSASLLLILIGFGCSAPVLLGLGIAAGLGYLSNYYYSLSLTLLTKSFVLIGSGVLLLALRKVVFRKA